ncbi:MAG TPA: signal peptidase I [Abditibacterium sp.]|jgi:signal peptidase I
MFDSTTFNLDSWPVKIAILLALVTARYAFFKWRPRGSRWQIVATSGRELADSTLLTLTLVFLLMQPFIAQAFYIPTGSMENTLPPGDKILVSKFIYRASEPKAGDVVVFEAPDAALISSGQPRGTFFVKRCIGAPGDVVEIRNRTLFRNGVRVAEPYSKWKDGNEAILGRFSYDLKIVGGAVYSRSYHPFSGAPELWSKNGVVAPIGDQNFITAAKPGKVPAERFLMLGDHRNASNDGHVWGFVPRQNIIGKTFAVFWPPRHWGVVDRKSAS